MDRRGIAAGTIYFNPRTREGCDAFLDVDLYPIQAISIHAPVKGATFEVAVLHGLLVISIHAPVKGATPQVTQRQPGLIHFNPRTREGCDYLSVGLRRNEKIFQSTHP